MLPAGHCMHACGIMKPHANPKFPMITQSLYNILFLQVRCETPGVLLESESS